MFNIRNYAEEIILKDTFVRGKKYQNCLSVIDCYEYYKPSKYLNVTIDNKTNYLTELYVTIGNNKNIMDVLTKFYFGYDRNQ